MGEDGAAELAIKNDIEDSWKKKSGNYCCMCLIFLFSLSLNSTFQAFEITIQGEKESNQSLVGSLELQWNKKTETHGEEMELKIVI